MRTQPISTPMILGFLILVTTFSCASFRAEPIYSTALAAPSTDLSVYGDSLSAGWENWTWGTTHNLSNPSPMHSGSASISATYTEAWAAIYFHSTEAMPSANYTALHFWINGGSVGGQSVAVKIIDDSNGNWDPLVQVTPQANRWTQVTVTLADLGNPATIGGLVWQDTTGGTQPTFYLDDITLVARTGPPPTQAPPVAGPALSVNAQASRRAISPYIYGMNFASESLAAELRLPVNRWGGNAVTRYNWQLDVHNTGSDWYFENIPDENPHPEQLPDGSNADRFVEANARAGAQSLITVPLIGWTPKRRLANHPYDCGFKVSKYGAQQSTDPWDPDCGNGKNPGGTDLTGNDPHDTSLAIGPDFVSDWIKHLAGKYGRAANSGVRFYNLDNEPMLWPYTHRDVHPTLTSYDEIRDRTYAYATALKAADPTAQTLGPVVWGWCAYFFSALDGCAPGSDYSSHGNLFFVDWYLQQMRSYEQDHGVRLLDYLDLHYYPQASGVALSPAGNSTTQALRLRSTRSLWDPNYTDESWINQAVRLIPRMREWVDANYPGTKLAITEYNWGGLEHINGALAQADVLGIFGRQGLDLATLWNGPQTDEPGAYAFRMYRNYDGTGGAFGEISVQAASTDQARLSIYAAQRAGAGALTIIVINKTGESMTSSLSIAGFSPAAAAQVYRYSAENLDAILRQPDQAVSLTGFTATFSANSITLFVLPSANASTCRLYLPTIPD